MSVKKVYLIFKTHLDIGFTDYAENVKEKYLTQYIPNAIATARQLQGTDTPFVWTVGSWLIRKTRIGKWWKKPGKSSGNMYSRLPESWAMMWGRIWPAPRRSLTA